MLSTSIHFNLVFLFIYFVVYKSVIQKYKSVIKSTPKRNKRLIIKYIKTFKQCPATTQPLLLTPYHLRLIKVKVIRQIQKIMVVES